MESLEPQNLQPRTSAPLVFVEILRSRVYRAVRHKPRTPSLWLLQWSPATRKECPGGRLVVFYSGLDRNEETAGGQDRAKAHRSFKMAG